MMGVVVIEDMAMMPCGGRKSVDVGMDSGDAGDDGGGGIEDEREDAEEAEAETERECGAPTNTTLRGDAGGLFASMSASDSLSTDDSSLLSSESESESDSGAVSVRRSEFAFFRSASLSCSFFSERDSSEDLRSLCTIFFICESSSFSSRWNV